MARHSWPTTARPGRIRPGRTPHSRTPHGTTPTETDPPEPGRTVGRRRRIAVTGLAVAAVAGTVLTGTAFADGDGPAVTEGTPCSAEARACVNLATNEAWLIHDGKITRGPVGISHGGQGKETPTGHFQVQWKDEHHRSAEYNNAPMPYSVFFADGGIAFHEGNPQNPSAGCVHLAHDDAVAWYQDLQVGDRVEIH